MVTAAARVGAAVDVGSNSVHLLVADVAPAHLVSLLDESMLLGLGDLVDRHGVLTTGAREATLSALEGYVARARSLGADPVTLLGTEPLRRAADSASLVEGVRERLGLRLHVISHAQEAQLTLLGVLGGEPAREPLMVLDIGGGSSEIIVAQAGSDPLVAVLPTGSARLTAALVAHDPPAADEIAALRGAASALLPDLPASPQGPPRRCIVTGGTGTNLAVIVRGARQAGTFVIDRPRLDAGWRVVSSLASSDLAAAHGLNLRRARQMAAGMAILEAALARYGLVELEVSTASLREGAIRAAALAGDAWPERLADLVAGRC